MIRPFLLVLLTVGLSLWGLQKANLPQRLRHRQVWSPIVAFLLTAGIVYVQWKVGSAMGQRWTDLVRVLDQFVARFGIPVGALFSLAANLFLLTVYTVVKVVVNRIIAWFKLRPRRLRFWPGYQDHPEHGMVLRNEWIYPGMLFRAAGWAVGGVLLFLLVFSAFLYPVPFVLPRFPVLVAILLLEAGWYLDGVPLSERAGRFSGPATEPARRGDFTALWEEYQRTWPRHVLAASSSVRLAPAGAPPPIVYRRPDEGDEQQQAVTAAWHALVAAGHPLSDVHYRALERLWRGDDVLVGDADYALAAPVLFAFLHKVLVDGHTVLVLVPSARRADPAACAAVEGWLREGLRGTDESGGLWATCRFDEFQRMGTRPDLLVAAAEELLGRGVADEAWFGRLKTVLVLEGDRAVFEAPMRTDAVMRVLRRRHTGLQQVILAGDRRTLESAMRDNLAGSLSEFRPPRPAPAGAFAIVWSTEALPAAKGEEAPPARFQDRVLIGAAGDIGPEAVLALPAWRDQVSPIRLVDQEGLPWAESVEELENRRGGVRDPIPSHALSGSAHEVVRVPPMPRLLPRERRAFVLARDRDRNLAAALRAWVPTAEESAFVHVVSPPYLLRDYLAANLGYFAQAPLLPLSPRLAESRLVVAYSLLERLTTAPLTEGEVLSELRAVEPSARFVEDALRKLFREVLEVDPFELNLVAIRREQRFDEGRGRFEERVTYQLSPEVKSLDSLQWLRRYRILDLGEHELGWVAQDHLSQLYLLGQVHAFQGKPFKVERVDPASGIVWVDHESGEEDLAYRPVRIVALEKVREPENPSHRRRLAEGGWELEITLCRGDFRVRTPGYFAFRGDLRLSPGGAVYTSLDAGQATERDYRDGRILRIRVTPPEAVDAAARDRVADTLCVLLQEAFPTLYPETHPFLLACAPGSAARWSDAPIRALMPLLGPEPGDAGSIGGTSADRTPIEGGSVEGGSVEGDSVDPESGDRTSIEGGAGDGSDRSKKGKSTRAREEVRAKGDRSKSTQDRSTEADRSTSKRDREPLVLYFLEDSHAPLGLTLSLFDEGQGVLTLLEDYLSWVLEEKEKTVDDGWRRPALPRDRFLRFGLDAPPPALDLAATHGFLRRMLQGRNPQREERRAFLRGERGGAAGAASADTRQCDFCGRVLPSADFEQLSDGRERCAQCKATAVDTLPELKRVYAEARDFLVHDLGKTVRRDVHVQFADAAQVQQAAGQQFMPTARYDQRSGGATAREADGFSILVENGQPHHRTLGTLVHELTHIWTYTNLDFERMEADHGLLLIEGLAQWAELTCLQQKGLVPELRGLEESRADVFGHGYRMVLEWQRQHAHLGDPFEILRSQYPAPGKE